MTLHLYFARRFFLTFLALFFGFFTLILLVDFIEVTRRFPDIAMTSRLSLALLNAPEMMDGILPLILLLATLSFFLALARSSELVVTRAIGRSALGALIAPSCVALLIGLGAVLLLGPISATTNASYNERRDFFRTGSELTFSVSTEGLWLREGNALGQTVIHAERSAPDASAFFDVSFVNLDPSGHPTRRVEAKVARLEDGVWRLWHAQTWPLSNTLNPQANISEYDTLTLPSNLTPERIQETLSAVDLISIWAMPSFIAELRQAGFSTLRHQVRFQSELARPLFFIGMVLVAAAFTMRHTRLGRTGVSALAALLLGFGLYFVRSFAQILGENGQVPILLAAWAPPAVAILLALGLLLQLEDG